MTLKRLPRIWRSGEMSRAAALVVWSALGLTVAIIFLDWTPFKSAVAMKPQARAHANRIVNGDEIYTGSIVFVPLVGDNCWERMIDNRNGQMWDKGYIDCYDPLLQNGGAVHATLSGDRMRAIGRALRHDN